VASPPSTARAKRKPHTLAARPPGDASKPQPTTSEGGAIAALALRFAILIAGLPSSLPDWLMPGLRRAASGIVSAKRKQDEYPGRNRNAQRAEWQRLRGECHDLVEMLDDYPAILALTDASGFDDLDGHRDARHGLLALTKQLDAAIAKTPEGKGRHKAYTGTSPQLACAIYVAVAWQEIRGTPAPHTSAAVHAACELLWQIAGMPPRARAGAEESLKGWREHVLKAKQELQAGYYANQRNTLLGQESYETKRHQR
jgi:hypothetical protein